jgi:hypothetical protein
MADDNKRLLDYIKMQWDDIHQSRMQDWSYIGVIAGVFYAFVQIQQSEIRLGLCLIGVVRSALGDWMAWEHYLIFNLKIGLINENVRKSFEVEQGVVIVPPGVDHCVRLSGLTYVFQAAVSGGQVHLDKVTTGGKAKPHPAQPGQ